MSSSDSEDDCYTNAAKRLKIMQSNYKDEIKVNISELFDDEEEVIQLETPKKKEKVSPIKYRFHIKSLDDFDQPIQSKTGAKSKGVLTRSEARKLSIEIPTVTNLIPKKTVVSPPKKISPPKSTPSRRGKTRKRPRNRTFIPVSTANVISIGNTAEYPDCSENQVLFNDLNSDVIIKDEPDVVEGSLLEENEQMSVKVFWQSSEAFRFHIRKYQNIKQIFDFFEKKEGVEIDKLFFMYNENILKPDDTPDSINYNIAKFIEGGVVYHNYINKTSKNNSGPQNGLKIKYQFYSQKKIKPFEVEVEPNEVIIKSMFKCAEYLETELCNLKFKFDGEVLCAKKTVSQLDFEGGEVIDVVIINPLDSTVPAACRV